MYSRRVLLYIVIGLLVLLGFVLFRRRIEGFTEQRNEVGKGINKGKEQVENALVSLMTIMKRMTRNLADPVMLKERLEMFSMSPIELARRHLQRTEQTNPTKN